MSCLLNERNDPFKALKSRNIFPATIFQLKSLNWKAISPMKIKSLLLQQFTETR